MIRWWEQEEGSRFRSNLAALLPPLSDINQHDMILPIQAPFDVVFDLDDQQRHGRLISLSTNRSAESANVPFHVYIL